MAVLFLSGLGPVLIYSEGLFFEGENTYGLYGVGGDELNGQGELTGKGRLMEKGAVEVREDESK